MSEPNAEGGWLEARAHEGCSFGVQASFVDTGGNRIPTRAGPRFCGVGDDVRKEDTLVVDDRRGVDVPWKMVLGGGGEGGSIVLPFFFWRRGRVRH